MRKILPDILSIMIAVAGWYYLFHSGEAVNLQGVESEPLNRRRIRLRRAGGAAMILLSIGLLLGFNSVDAEKTPGRYLLVWTAVMLLLMLVVILAVIDLRMTWRLPRDREGRDGP